MGPVVMSRQLSNGQEAELVEHSPNSLETMESGLSNNLIYSDAFFPENSFKGVAMAQESIFTCMHLYHSCTITENSIKYIL